MLQVPVLLSNYVDKIRYYEKLKFYESEVLEARYSNKISKHGNMETEIFLISQVLIEWVRCCIDKRD